MRTRLLASALAAAALLSATACSSEASSSIKSSNSAPASPPPTASAAPTSTATTPASGIPSPNAAQTAGLLAALKAVNPALATDQAKAVSRARNVCQEIKAGKDDATLAANAASRFSGGDTTLTPEQGAVIVAGVKASFCS